MESSAGQKFLDFTDKDKQRLLEAYVYIRPSIPSILEKFYASLISIGSGPQKYGIDPEHLKSRQSEHWRHLFRGKFDRAYENAARRVAIRHFEIGLPHDLYVLSYMKALLLFSEVLRRAPDLDRTQASDMMDSVTKAIAIDMVHAMSPYTGDLV
jgi:Protoglobin